MRNEKDKITMAPIKVTFGDKEYDIKPLRVLKQQEWRVKAKDLLGPVVDKMTVVRLANNTLVTGLPTAIAPFPDAVIELLFLYATNLEKEKILEEATEEQIAVAFSQIWDLVFADFLSLLAKATEILKTPSSQPANA
jgi:hypothetical protein